MFISITRLRLRHWWYLPAFFLGSNRSITQARKAPGFRKGITLADRKRAFWTLTGWESEAAMKAYRSSGPHKTVMGKLPGWCDEAAVAHYQADELPPWTEAWERLEGGTFHFGATSLCGSISKTDLCPTHPTPDATIDLNQTQFVADFWSAAAGARNERSTMSFTSTDTG